MKYIYTALLLHASGSDITEENVRNVLSATGGEIDEARVKALVASLSEVNIEEAIKAAPGLALASATPATAEKAPTKEEETKEEETKEEEAIAGLGALFE